MNNNCHEYDFGTQFLLQRCNKPFYFCSKETFLSRAGGHFHIASKMELRQVSVRFFALKSAKGVFLTSKACKGCHFQVIKFSNLRKIIIFFDQIREILRNFFNNAKIYS